MGANRADLGAGADGGPPPGYESGRIGPGAARLVLYIRVTGAPAPVAARPGTTATSGMGHS
jgi:hypothetical protein